MSSPRPLVPGSHNDLSDKTILILGGAGMVGLAVGRALLRERPDHLVVHSLRQHEATEASVYLQELASSTLDTPVPQISSTFGDIFVRTAFKDRERRELLSDSEHRALLLDDLLSSLSDENVKNFFLWELFEQYEPNIVIDCINTATAVAYQNIFEVATETLMHLESDTENTKATVESLVCSLPLIQLTKHTQVLHKTCDTFGTEFYLKVGTTGTGGMGLNIPYTHGEDRPSRQLMSKSALAGAHSLLLYLMYADPGLPITREFKPSAAIAWKRIGYDVIKKHGEPIQLFDCPEATATLCRPGERLHRRTDETNLSALSDDQGEPENLQAVFIDTGENGFFSLAEFKALTTQNQMEYVTPEEIAANVVYEVRGSNTGCDILSAIRSATMGPSYRAGFLRSVAIERVEQLEAEYGESIAFEFLGPPRLSKLLFEAFLLKSCIGTLGDILKADPETISTRCCSYLNDNNRLRARILSIGIPILLPGQKLLRGREISHPNFGSDDSLVIQDQDQIEAWTEEGWVDLRVSNWEGWRKRIQKLKEEIEGIPEDDQSATTSYFSRTDSFWAPSSTVDQLELDIGEVVGWLFIREGGGRRGHPL